MAVMAAGEGGPDERKRRERRQYVERRAQRTAVADAKGPRRRPWAIDEVKTALDPALTVPEAALKVGRTSSAVESLRKRWRSGQLGAALEAHVLPPNRSEESS